MTLKNRVPGPQGNDRLNGSWTLTLAWKQLEVQNPSRSRRGEKPKTL